MQTFERINRGPATTPAAGSYPKGDLGKAFANAARIVRGDVGVEVITIDYGKWDMHSGLGDLDWGQMLENATEMSQAVAAFFADLGALGDQVTLVALSEFGRRVQENINMGLDHGYGNVMMVAGAGVKGGYYGTWPGLTNELDSDLLVTTDYRSVLSEVVAGTLRRQHRLGLPRLRSRTGRGDARPVKPITNSERRGACPGASRSCRRPRLGAPAAPQPRTSLIGSNDPLDLVRPRFARACQRVRRGHSSDHLEPGPRPRSARRCRGRPANRERRRRRPVRGRGGLERPREHRVVDHLQHRADVEHHGLDRHGRWDSPPPDGCHAWMPRWRSSASRFHA